MSPPVDQEQAADELLGKLRQVPVLSDLPDEEILGLLDSGTPRRVPAGTVILEEGTPGDQFYFILDGMVEVSRLEGGRPLILDIQGAGGFLSEMSLLEDRPRSASARALSDTMLLTVDPEEFLALLTRCPGVALSMLRTVMARLRSTETALIEKGRMAGLGTMAAGFAHELNNPAAAVVRSADLLETALVEWRRCFEVLHELHLGPGERVRLAGLGPLLHPPETSPRAGQAARRNEEDVEAWLIDRGIEESWTLAPILAEAGWDRSRLEDLAGQLVAEHLEPVLRWVSSGAEALTLLDALKRGARAISGIVAGVRTYASLDRGPAQDVDIRENLANTLAILKGRIGPRIKVLQSFSEDLPRVEGHGGELGQVWTNLIMNALASMGGEGTLDIRARRDRDRVLVQVMDDGPGIPSDVRPRIFDPFFTTRPEGQGMGLGLAIVHGVVTKGHRGSIRVDSRPGRTVFEVALPASAPHPREQPES